MVRRTVVLVLVALLAACGGDGGEDLAAVCDDFHALVTDGQRLPEDWSAFEPVVDRAADVDALQGAAANIRNDVERDSVDGLQASVEGFYNRCQANGWDGLD